jgi:ABC-2 type transport system ATP-binding protein
MRKKIYLIFWVSKGYDMLIIEHVSKTFTEGKIAALNDITFRINRGEFIALLGQNGAGKSTLINTIAGNVRKSKGKISIGGYDLDSDELKTKKVFGVVPQEISFDFAFSVIEILRNQSGYFGIKNNDRYIDELLEGLSLSEKKYAPSRTLSGGMKRRLLIAKALVHKPKLLILDEPTAGVDIELRHSLYAFLRKLHAEGTTIILTTHYLEEAEKLCDRVIVLHEGKMLVDESKEMLMEKFGSETLVEFQFDYDLDDRDILFFSSYSPKILEMNKLQLIVNKNEIGNIFQKISKENMKFTNFKLEHQKLEDVFLQLVN